MSVRPLRKALLLLGAGVFVAAAAGCGSNPPCETDLAAVDAARSRAQAADQKLEDAKAQLKELEQQVAAEEARKASLAEKKQELKEKIEELGG
jgi:hypothetical protein